METLIYVLKAVANLIFGCFFLKYKWVLLINLQMFLEILLYTRLHVFEITKYWKLLNSTGKFAVWVNAYIICVWHS